MKRRILTTLLTMCMVLMLLRIPAYAGSAYCDICGKWVRTTGTYEYKDAGYHWHHVYCTECGTNITNPRSAHVWSGTATCTSGQTCTICGGTSTPLGHDWNSNWISDENNHWHECNVCAEKGDVGIHIWDNGTITISQTCTTEGGEKVYLHWMRQNKNRDDPSYGSRPRTSRCTGGDLYRKRLGNLRYLQ